MADNFLNVIDHLLLNEGGFVNDPFDRGGATIHGVTLKNWRAYTGQNVTIERFKALGHKDVMSFYRNEYWDKVNAELLPQGVDYYVFDYAVNSGVSRSAKALQRIVGVYEDGRIGDITLAAINDYLKIRTVKDLILDIDYQRRQFLKQIKTFWRFGRGWFNRLEKVLSKSFELINEIPVKVKPIENSRTINASKKQIAVTVATGGVAATNGVQNVSSLPDVAQVVSDIQTVNTLASGVSGLMSYGFYVGIAIIIIYGLYQVYLRIEDWFTGDRR